MLKSLMNFHSRKCFNNSRLCQKFHSGFAACSDRAAVWCFSGCWCAYWAGGDISWWRGANWRRDRLTVERRFCWWETWDAWEVRWYTASSRLWDKSACDKTSKQPSSLLPLYDIVSSHQSAWSMAYQTTQTHYRVTVYFPLGQHWPWRQYSSSLGEETHLASDWLRTMPGVLPFFAK